MAQNIELETKVITTYFEKNKRDRYIQFISNSKTRNKLVKDLSHFKHFNWKLFDEVIKDDEEVIQSLLRQYNVPAENCYVISGNSVFDTQTIDIVTAFREVIGHDFGTILIFGDADVIFYDGEGPQGRYIGRPH